MELHWPYISPPPFNHIFDHNYMGKHTFNDLDNGKIKRGDNVFNNNLSEEERNHAIAHYDGGIRYLDYHVGRLIDFLKNKRTGYGVLESARPIDHRNPWNRIRRAASSDSVTAITEVIEQLSQRSEARISKKTAEGIAAATVITATVAGVGGKTMPPIHS